MYKQIRTKQTSYPKVYFEKLKSEGLLSTSRYDEIRKKASEGWEKDFNIAKSIEKVSLKDYTSKDRKGQKTLTDNWKDFKPSIFGEEYPTNFTI
jgi:2-oxoglutarate dehydrogenase complex dehydrogenase (E1) component-like enzyme